MEGFNKFFITGCIAITFLTPVGMLIAGFVDFCVNRKIGRTLPRFLLALVTYPLLILIGFTSIILFEIRTHAFDSDAPSGINLKIFLILLLLAYGICCCGFIAFVAQKLPFLKEVFNPVEENLPSILTTK